MNEKVPVVEKELRVAAHRGGDVLLDRVVPPGALVTIGWSPEAMIRAAQSSELFPVVTSDRGCPVLQVLEGHTVAIKRQPEFPPEDLAELDANACVEHFGPFRRIHLSSEMRGRVGIGDVVVIFNFVEKAAPPEPTPRPSRRRKQDVQP